MTDEIWKDTKYPGYKVSNLGRVIGKRGKLLSSNPSEPLGYVMVGIHQNKKQTTMFVHRLVLETFVGPCPEGMEACHNDGIPSNNRLDNLRWDTRSANFLDQVKHGVHANARKTHCPRNHPLKEPNLVKSRQGRSCLSCQRASAYAYARTHNKGEVWTDNMISLRADTYYSRLSLLLHVEANSD